MPAHKNNTQEFEELSYSGQAKAIDMYILHLKDMILAHKRRATQEGKQDSTGKFIANIENMLKEL